jgi:polysaccharide export outer membrane protein
MRTLQAILISVAAVACGSAAFADTPVAPANPASAPAGAEYHLQPGDILSVSVWKEQDLSGDVLVRPDGGVSFPLVGDVIASEKSVAALRLEFTERLKRYIPNPVVTVAVKTIGGNRVYVVGKVLRPGEYPFSAPVDVMQALSLAGGTTPFAAVNDIVILRRQNGQLRAIPFHYGAVEHGKSLAQDIVLESCDTVVVP